MSAAGKKGMNALMSRHCACSGWRLGLPRKTLRRSITVSSTTYRTPFATRWRLLLPAGTGTSRTTVDLLAPTTAIHTRCFTTKNHNIDAGLFLQDLNVHYSKEYQKQNVSRLNMKTEAAVATKNNISLGWTATFTCPVTQQIYPSGTLLLHSTDSTENVPQNIEIHEDGTIYYRKKKDAINAAAARALDDIRFRATGQLEPRYCQEEPISMIPLSAVTAVDIPYDEDTQDEDDEEEDPMIDDIVASIGLDALEDNVTGGVTVADSDGGSQGQSKDIPEDTEDYVISHLPATSSGGQRPFERVLEAISTRLQPASNISNSSAAAAAAIAISSNMPTGTIFGPSERVWCIVQSAKTWAQANQPNRKSNKADRRHSLHRVVLRSKKGSSAAASPHTLLLGKALLSQLAQAHFALPIFSRNVGVENAANRILDVLWKTAKKSSNQVYAPDADTYSSYLKCLEGPNPKAIAERAEDIVQHMIEGKPWKGRVLPQPNTAVMNSLIQLWAQLGGTTGRRYEQFQHTFEPDRETFLALLSSSTYIPFAQKEYRRRFDLDFARDCIQKIQELDREGVDAQVYNAPLRWSGGSLGPVIRPYARYIPFDNYDAIFGQHGLRPEEDVDAHSVEEANAMEEWKDEIEKKGLATIETHEALLQAWIRTKSLSGLEKAEAIAERLLEDPVTSGARLQTFHPIIATWLHTRHNDGPHKIQHWMNRLTEASKQVPELKPDGRIVEAILAANVYRQGRLLNGASSPSLVQEDVIGAAVLCSTLLEDHCYRLEETLLRSNNTVDVFAEVSLFVYGILAWQNVISADGSLDQCLEELFRILTMFDRLLEVLGAVDDVGLRSTVEPSLQLQHFMENGHVIYTAFVKAVNDIQKAEEKLDIDKASDSIARSLVWIERSIRRTGEFWELERKDADDEDDNDADNFRNTADGANTRLSYGDLFSYWSSGNDRNFLRPQRMTFFWRVIYFFRQAPLDTLHRGDVVRICLLIRELSAAHEMSMKLREEINEFLDDLLMNTKRRGTKRGNGHYTKSSYDRSEGDISEERSWGKTHHRRPHRSRRKSKRTGRISEGKQET